MKRGFDLLRDKALNRSIAFKRKDRGRLGLEGLLLLKSRSNADLQRLFTEY